MLIGYSVCPFKAVPSKLVTHPRVPGEDAKYAQEAQEGVPWPWGKMCKKRFKRFKVLPVSGKHAYR